MILPVFGKRNERKIVQHILFTLIPISNMFKLTKLKLKISLRGK
jgi:hypothetical protein